jgi:TatD DNase family protein
MKLIDIGVNLTDSMFRGIYRGSVAHASDLHLVSARAKTYCIERAIITSTHLKDIPDALELIEESLRRGEEEEDSSKSVSLFTTVGVHPTRCGEFEMDMQMENKTTTTTTISTLEERADAYYKKLENYIQQDRKAGQRRKIVAIGECGLDWDRTEFCSKELQIKYFVKQLDLSTKFNLVKKGIEGAGRVYLCGGCQSKI